MAIGSQTSYFGHDAWKQWAPGLKSIDEAVNVRHKILYAFEVAERISRGWQNKEIAEDLFIGQRTVEHYIRTLFVKLKPLGVTTRVGIAQWWTSQEDPE